MKILIILFLISCNCYSEDTRYTKHQIPIKFIGLYDVSYDTDGLDKDSLIYIIKEQEKARWRLLYK